MDHANPIPASSRAPRGFHAAKVDSAGRLKLPASYNEHLEKAGDRVLYVTLIQGQARIFTNGSWERYLAKLDPEPALKNRIAYYADVYGEDVTVDGQGRVTLPQILRKQLGLENQPVQLRYFEDVITIHPQKQYEADLGKVEASIDNDFERARGLGFIF